MAGGSKSNPPKPRKRVNATSIVSPSASLVRAKGGSAFPNTQVVEKPAEVKKKDNPSTMESNPRKPKKLKKGKGHNAPKHPPTAFFLFMEDFRKSQNEANPNAKYVTGVAKQGGEKWKSMLEEEKKCYIDKAAELKAEYEKALEDSNDADNQNDEDVAALEKGTLLLLKRK